MRRCVSDGDAVTTDDTLLPLSRLLFLGSVVVFSWLMSLKYDLKRRTGVAPCGVAVGLGLALQNSVSGSRTGTRPTRLAGDWEQRKLLLDLLVQRDQEVQRALSSNQTA